MGYGHWTFAFSYLVSGPRPFGFGLEASLLNLPPRHRPYRKCM